MLVQFKFNHSFNIESRLKQDQNNPALCTAVVMLLASKTSSVLTPFNQRPRGATINMLLNQKVLLTQSNELRKLQQTTLHHTKKCKKPASSK